MAIGGFPGIMAQRRATVSAPKNPMDKSTIISIFPREIYEIKPTISPGVFIIPPGTPEKPSILVVGSSSWWKEIDEEQPLLEIPNGSVQIADSVVKDYCNGLIACNMVDAMPGLFWVPGEFKLAEAQAKFPDKFKEAKAKQDNWYSNLVKMGDTMWARTNGNPLSISDDMRMAAKILGLNAKDWMQDFTMMQMVKCPACGMSKNPDYPVCSHCHAVTDAKKAKELGLEFAKF